MAVQCAEDNADDDECDADLKNLVCTFVCSLGIIHCWKYSHEDS